MNPRHFRLHFAAALIALLLLLGTAMPAAAQGSSFTYFNVAGSSFVPRGNTSAPVYQGGGCVARASLGDFLVYPLQLPTGSQIRYVRVYYNDTSSADLTVALTRYDGIGGFVDETVFNNTGISSGYGSTLSPELNAVVDNLEQTRQLLVNFGEASATLQFCGIRVAYFSDVIFRNGLQN